MTTSLPPPDPMIVTLSAEKLNGYVSTRYGVRSRLLRKVDPERLRPVIGLLANSGVLYPEEVGCWLQSRVERLGWARPIVLLRRRDSDSLQRVTDAALAHVRALEGGRSA